MTCCQHWNLSRKTNFALPHPPQSPVFVLKFWRHHGVLRFEMVGYPQKLFGGSKIAMAVVQPDVDRLSWLLAVFQQWLPQPLQACLRVSPPGNTLLRKSDDPIIIADFSLSRESDNQIIILILIVYSPQSGELLCSSPRQTGCHERVPQSRTEIISMGLWMTILLWKKTFTLKYTNQSQWYWRPTFGNHPACSCQGSSPSLHSRRPPSQ